MKVSGGLVGITLNEAARTKFFLIAPRARKPRAQAKDMAGVSSKPQGRHHNLTTDMIYLFHSKRSPGLDGKEAKLQCITTSPTQRTLLKSIERTPVKHEDQDGAHPLFGPKDKEYAIVVEGNWWWHGEVSVRQHTRTWDINFIQ